MKLISQAGRRAVLMAGLLACVAGALPAVAQTGNQGFEVLSPSQPTSAPAGKVEVLEFFSYGCSHCNQLEPLFEDWQKKVGKDVVVKRVPVAFSGAWVPLQKLYFTLEALGVGERLNGQVFRAIHNDNKKLHDEKVQLEWVVAQGVDRKKFQDMYASFTVQSAVMRAQQLSKEYKISGVPTLAVAGRYITSASLTGSHEAALATVDQLIAKTRSEQGRK